MKSKKSYFTVTEKGQVTIPRNVRRQLGIEPGTRVRFEIEDGRIVMTKAATDPVTAVFGAAGRITTDRFLATLRPGKP